MKKIKSIVVGIFVIAFLAINALVVFGDANSNSNSNLSLRSLMNLSVANAEDDCQPACGPGFACINGVCVQREAAVRTSCTVSVFCWLQLKWVSAPGHQTTCPNNSEGITNCMGSACEADVDPC